jgi:hypothetical protein
LDSDFETSSINRGKSVILHACARTTLLSVGEMLRQQLLRSSRRLKRLNGANGCRSFTASARRHADVELTVGEYFV